MSSCSIIKHKKRDNAKPLIIIENAENQNTDKSKGNKVIIENESNITDKSDKNANRVIKIDLALLSDIMDERNLGDKYEIFYNGGIQLDMEVDDLNYDKLINYAKSFLGTPHRTGGLSKSGIDCSGLLYVSFQNQGFESPRTAQDFGRYGTIIVKKNQLKKGDLVFFTGTTSTSKLISHVGIFLGDNKFIHTSSSKGVTISDINNKYWSDKFIFGTRLK